MKQIKAGIVAIFTAAQALLLSGCVSTNAPKTEAQTSEAAPFARVALALRGCSSCSNCRSTIRQTAKAASQSDSVKVGADDVEVIYRAPQSIPLREVVDRLANNGMHDLTLVDVLFDTEGELKREANGELTFSLRETHQSFPFKVTDSQKVPQIGKPLHLRTVVRGWENKQGSLFLELKYSLDPELASENDDTSGM